MCEEWIIRYRIKESKSYGDSNKKCPTNKRKEWGKRNVERKVAHLIWKLQWAILIACLYVCLSTVHIPFISRTTGIISTKLGTKDHWLIGIKVYSNERSRSLRRRITDTKYKCMDKIKDLLLNHWAKLGTKHILW